MKQVSQAVLRRCFFRWFFGSAAVFTPQRMQTLGLVYAMEPAVRDLYPEEEEYRKRLNSYRTLFNTEVQIGSAVIGMAIGLEEDRANGSGMDDDLMRTIRSGLMGSLAGLGDALLVGALIPLLLCIALDLGLAGAVSYLLVYGILGTWLQYRLFLRVYHLRDEGLAFLYSSRTKTAVRILQRCALLCIGIAMGHYGLPEHTLPGLSAGILLVLCGSLILRRTSISVRGLLGIYTVLACILTFVF